MYRSAISRGFGSVKKPKEYLFPVDTDGICPVPVDIENVTCITLYNVQQISHHSLGCFTWIHCSLMRLVMLYTPKRFEMLLPSFEKTSPSILMWKKLCKKSFISGHKSQVSQAWVPCQTTFARSNQSTDCKQLDVVARAFTKIEEVSKKSCGKRKRKTLCFFVLGISEFDVLCNMLFKPFSKLSFWEILRSNKITNQKPGSSARDLLERSKWSAFEGSIQVTWKNLDNKLTRGKSKPPSNLCRGHRVCHNHLKRCPKNIGETLYTSPRDKRYLSIFRGPIFPCNGWFWWWTPGTG